MIFEEFELLKQKKLHRINDRNGWTQFTVLVIESYSLIQDFLGFSKVFYISGKLNMSSNKSVYCLMQGVGEWGWPSRILCTPKVPSTCGYKTRWPPEVPINPNYFNYTDVVQHIFFFRNPQEWQINYNILSICTCM